MDKVLIVSSSEKGTELLGEILSGVGLVQTDSSTCGSEARRRLSEGDYDLVIINVPLSDEQGTELAADIAADSDTGVILLVRAEIADRVQASVEDSGVFVVAKPVSRQLLYQAVKFVTVSRKRVQAARAKAMALQKKLDDLKVIDRAKCCLIQYLKMTEPQAHRHIEKQAMDQRTSKREVAEKILVTLET